MTELQTGIETGAETSATDETSKATEQSGAPQEKSPDEIEIEKRAQAEFDKRISKALATREEKLRKQFEEEKAEAERLTKMSEDEKRKAIEEKQRAEFEKQKREFERSKLELEVVKKLNEKNISIKFSKYLTGESLDESIENITEFETEFRACVNKGVDDRLKGFAEKPETADKNGGTKGNSVTGKSVLDTLNNL
jgi:DNA-nicking Smr family endonuclease